MYQNQLYQSPLGCKFMTVILKSWLNFIGPISLVSQTITDRQMSLIWCCVVFFSLWTTKMHGHHSYIICRISLRSALMFLYTLDRFMNVWKLSSKSGLFSWTSETTHILQGEKFVKGDNRWEFILSTRLTHYWYFKTYNIQH